MDGLLPFCENCMLGKIWFLNYVSEAYIPIRMYDYLSYNIPQMT